MISKNPKPLFKIILGVSLITLTMASCNGSGKKDPPADTTSVMPSQPLPVDTMKIDTSKMDTATTRPVKTPD